MKWYTIIVTIICAVLIAYLVFRHPKTIEIPVQVFHPDTAMIKEVVFLKAEKAVLLTENENLKNKINSYVYKKPPIINGSDSDLSHSFGTILHSLR